MKITKLIKNPIFIVGSIILSLVIILVLVSIVKKSPGGCPDGQQKSGCPGYENSCVGICSSGQHYDCDKRSCACPDGSTFCSVDGKCCAKEQKCTDKGCCDVNNGSYCPNKDPTKLGTCCEPGYGCDPDTLTCSKHCGPLNYCGASNECLISSGLTSVQAKNNFTQAMGTNPNKIENNIGYACVPKSTCGFDDPPENAPGMLASGKSGDFEPCFSLAKGIGDDKLSGYCRSDDTKNLSTCYVNENEGKCTSKGCEWATMVTTDPKIMSADMAALKTGPDEYKGLWCGNNANRVKRYNVQEGKTCSLIDCWNTNITTPGVFEAHWDDKACQLLADCSKGEPVGFDVKCDIVDEPPTCQTYECASTGEITYHTKTTCDSLTSCNASVTSKNKWCISGNGGVNPGFSPTTAPSSTGECNVTQTKYAGGSGDQKCRAECISGEFEISDENLCPNQCSLDNMLVKDSNGKIVCKPLTHCTAGDEIKVYIENRMPFKFYISMSPVGSSDCASVMNPGTDECKSGNSIDPYSIWCASYGHTPYEENPPECNFTLTCTEYIDGNFLLWVNRTDNTGELQMHTAYMDKTPSRPKPQPFDTDFFHNVGISCVGSDTVVRFIIYPQWMFDIESRHINPVQYPSCY